MRLSWPFLYLSSCGARPENIAEGCLRIVSKRDEAGHMINKFYGHPCARMNAFIPTRRAVTRINPKPEPRFM